VLMNSQNEQYAGEGLCIIYYELISCVFNLSSLLVSVTNVYCLNFLRQL
jgi:hypothetical protein